jgi:phytoene desaturase
MKKVVIIGSGFAGLSAASYLAKEDCDVTVLEKNAISGGRARKFTSEGFTFDMGPSWYWMPEVFENFFSAFGQSTEDHFELKRLDPSYRIFWKDEPMDIPADYKKIETLFESIEAGSSVKLKQFLKEAEYKYKVGIHQLVQQPGNSFSEFIDIDLLKGIMKLDVFDTMKNHVRKFFSNPKLQQWMEFPVLFLGGLPSDIPALYSLMNYADLRLGTWYPMGGMYKIVEAMEKVATSNGVKFTFNCTATEVITRSAKATGVRVIQNGTDRIVEADVVIGAGDYHHIETLLPEDLRSYSEKYWEKRTMAPSALIWFIGINKRIKGIQHHNLFFDMSFDDHGREIYTDKKWPADPLFYVCAPSVSDESVAPEGCENLFFLIPVSAGLKGDSEELREHYFRKILIRFQQLTGEVFEDNIIYKRSYSVADFSADYNAYKGNAYGLANTLMQTAVFKPKMKSKKVKNLFYTGQLTVPGPGVPPAIISGEVVAREVLKCLTTKTTL